jgi:tetratricopeptide (TPR) repeat protein
MPLVMIAFIVLFSADAQRRDALREFDFNSRIGELEQLLQTQLPESRRQETRAALMDLYARQAEIYELMAESAAAAAEVYFDVLKNSETGVNATDYIFAGISAFERGEYDIARDRLHGALEKNVQLPEELRKLARTWLGASYYASGDRGRASAEWRTETSASTGCDEFVYVWARLKIHTDEAIDRCNSTVGETTGNQQVKTLIHVSLIQEQYDGIAALIRRFNGMSPAYIDRSDNTAQRAYYEPSGLRSLSLAYYSLASKTAGDLSAGLSPGDRAKLKTAYYRALYAYKSEKYDDVIDLLTGTDDGQSALLLAAASFRLGKREQAGEIIRYLERSGDDAVRSETGRIIAELHGQEYESRAIRLCESALRNAQNRTRSGIDQRLFRNLAHAYMHFGRYEEALEVFGSGFRSERRSDPAGNDPAFSIMFGSAIVQGKHFIALPDAIDMFSTVMQAYPAAVQLVEIASMIDVTTNIGREGRLMYRR